MVTFKESKPSKEFSNNKGIAVVLLKYIFLYIKHLATLYFLFKVRWARVIKNEPRGIYWRLRKKAGVGEEENICFFLAFRARSPSLRPRARRCLISKRTKRKIKQSLCTGY